MCLLLLLLASTIYGCKMKDKTEYDEFDEQYNEFMTRYKSTEQKAYYHVDEDEEWDYVPYKPMDSAEVKSYKNKFYKQKVILSPALTITTPPKNSLQLWLQSKT